MLTQSMNFAGISCVHICKPSWARHARNYPCSSSRYNAWQDPRRCWSEDTLLRVLQDNATGRFLFLLNCTCWWLHFNVANDLSRLDYVKSEGVQTLCRDLLTFQQGYASRVWADRCRMNRQLHGKFRMMMMSITVWLSCSLTGPLCDRKKCG